MFEVFEPIEAAEPVRYCSTCAAVRPFDRPRPTPAPDDPMGDELACADCGQAVVVDPALYVPADEGLPTAA